MDSLQKQLKIKEQRKKSKERPEYKKQQNAYQKVYQKKYYHRKKEEFENMKQIIKNLSNQKIEKQLDDPAISIKFYTNTCNNDNHYLNNNYYI
jgi:hypothetical protein